MNLKKKCSVVVDNKKILIMLIPQNMNVAASSEIRFELYDEKKIQ
jgi:hypothetical protein